jgi:molybdopterin/thiamine biosynthesis adenylyltransferase/rhodanese-related sulfurtransferase
MAINEISVREARRRQLAGAIFIDVREPDEHAIGLPDGAVACPRARIEATPAQWVATRDADVVLICGSGRRSLMAAEALAKQGYTRLASVTGGYSAWLAESLPVAAGHDADFLDRYSRHLRLPQVGIAGQEALAAARVVLVGAGGLGSPVAFYLAAAGVGHIRLIDDDVVDRSNLQRQILHTEARIGVAKVASAAETLGALNPRIHIEKVQERLLADNVDRLLADADVVVDGADNFPTRYLLSDACVRLHKPMVYGAVQRFEGQASVFDAGRRRGQSPCYRCLFPEPPGPGEAPNCAEAGVLGVLPGLIGLIQATEVLKLIMGLGQTLDGRLLHVDALSMRFREVRLSPDPDCPVCGTASGIA